MDKLFEIIFSNPIIMIAIIGGLFSLLGKSGKKRTNGMPTFGGNSTRSDTQTSGPNASEDDELITSTFSTMAEEREEGQGGMAYSSDPYSLDYASQVETASSRMAPPAPKEMETDSYQLNVKREEGGRISAEQARQGVIWAEILGPPRAKRPYGRRPIK